MRCVACVLSLLVISQSFWLAEAHDPSLIRKRRTTMSVSATGELSQVQPSLLETRVPDLLAEVESMVHSKRTPDRSKIKVIQDIVEQELLPDLMTTHNAAQQQVKTNLKAIDTCNSNTTSRQGQIKSSAEEQVNTTRVSHASCREEEETKGGTKSAKCTELDNFLNGVYVPENMPEGKPRIQMVQYVKTMKDYYCPKGPKVKELNAACKAAEGQHATHKAECDRKQATFEAQFCVWRTQLSDECSAFEKTCYDPAVHVYKGHVNTTRTLVTRWKSEYVALKKIACYVQVWMKDGDVHTVDHEQMAQCQQLKPDDSKMDINFGNVPPKASCDLSPVAKYPGTEQFETTEYSKFKDIVSDPIHCLKVQQ
jgi:hypothetical protein